MEATYDITSHKLLSDKAESLQQNESDVFDGQVVSAEVLHGLDGTDYSGRKLKLAKLILVHQVNYQLATDERAEIFKSIKKGDKTHQLKDVDAFSPKAKSIREALDAILEDGSPLNFVGSTSQRLSY